MKMWRILRETLTPLTFCVLLCTWGSFFLALPTTHPDINTLWRLALQIPLTVTPSESSIHYWLMVGLIEGPGGLLVLLVNGDPAALFQSTLPPPSMFYLSISPLPSSHALGWFDGIDPLHLLTSFKKKIYWGSCPTLKACWHFQATFFAAFFSAS